MKIQKIQLKNFKCFKTTEINFGKITLLTGANSSGKSSLIDSLLAVFQTVQFPVALSPNGKYKNIGGFENISHNGVSPVIEIALDFAGIYRQNDAWKIATRWQKSQRSALPVLERLNSEYAENAEKISLEIQKEDDYKLQSGNFTGNYGSFTEMETDITEKGFLGNNDFPIPWLDKSFNYIHSYREEPQRQYYQAVAGSKTDPTGKGYTQQIAQWEEIEKQKIGELTQALKKLKLLHSIKTEKRDDGTFKVLVKVHQNSIFVPLTDVGFGVSKLLPVIVADLQLGKNSLLALSEPEIDLHPSVQADFADYLTAQCFKNSKQYIIETHSEYLLNRLRLLISQGKLTEDEVKVYYFENNGEETKTYPVKFHKDGQITGAPDGFFETYETDVLNIALQD